MTDWVKRRLEDHEDADACLYLWLHSYSHSPYGRAKGADKHETPERAAYWAAHAPIVERMLATSDVWLLCDPQRVRREGKHPSVIWAFAAMSDDVVHYLVVKRAVIDIVGRTAASEMVRDLLGERLDKPCGYTHDIVQLRNASCGVQMPRAWYPDPTWWARKSTPPRPIDRAFEAA